jgi:ribosome recycling factor
MLKELLKDKSITEDEEKQGLKKVQDATDASITKIDELVAKKEGEIMEV